MFITAVCLCYIFNQATMAEDQEFVWPGSSWAVTS